MDETVGDIMTRNVVTLREEDNLEHVAEELETYRFRHLPVVDGNRVVGMVTQRDLFRLSVSSRDRTSVADARERRIEEGTFVGAIMTRDPMVIESSASIAAAAQCMAGAKVGALPVVDNDKLVGILTEQDLLMVLARLLNTPDKN